MIAAQNSKRRPVVTGMGAISPLGLTLSQSWNAAVGGHCAISRELIDASAYGPSPFHILVARVPGDPLAHLEALRERRIGESLDPFALYALAAATEAISQANLGAEQLKHAAIVLGHGMGGMHTLEAGYERFYGRRTTRVHPLTVPRCMVSAPVSAVAMEFAIEGPVFAVSSACSSSGHAIAQGALLIAAGLAEVAIVGGSDAIATPACLAAWENLRAVSATACRPFSLGRDGTAIGEGAAAIVLESAEHARARGAPIFAELTGIGMSSDAEHLTQPKKGGALESMRQACAAAGILEAENLLISAHGTGTPLNDANEMSAIAELFCERTHTHHVIATKSVHGHLMGASTALQIALGLNALQHRRAPPIANFLAPEPQCRLNLVIGTERAISCESMLVNSFAFGGLNCSLAFRRWSNKPS